MHLRCVCVGGVLLHGIKTPQQDFALKMQGELMRERGVFVGHYGTGEVYISDSFCKILI